MFVQIVGMRGILCVSNRELRYFLKSTLRRKGIKGSLLRKLIHLCFEHALENEENRLKRIRKTNS